LRKEFADSQKIKLTKKRAVISPTRPEVEMTMAMA